MPVCRLAITDGMILPADPDIEGVGDAADGVERLVAAIRTVVTGVPLLNQDPTRRLIDAFAGRAIAVGNPPDPSPSSGSATRPSGRPLGNRLLPSAS